jgi:hypothetical protein
MGDLNNPLLPIEGTKSASGLIGLIIFLVFVFVGFVFVVWYLYAMFKSGLEMRKELKRQREIEVKRKLEERHLVKKDGDWNS